MAPRYIAVGPVGNVKGSIDPDPPHVQFDDDPQIVMPTHTNAIAIRPDGQSALVRGNNDRTYRVNRVPPVEGPPIYWYDLDSAVGTYDVGYHPLTSEEYWIHSIPSYKRDGVEYPVPKDQTGDYISGQGWVQIYDSGLPAWTDQVGLRTLDGHTLARCVTLGNWVIGMETSSRGWILLTNTLTHEWYIAWKEYTPIGPSFVLRNGQPVAGISFPGIEVTTFESLSGGPPAGGPGTPTGPNFPNINIQGPSLGSWQIRVIATAIVYGPAPEDIPTIPPRESIFAGGTQPGPPNPGSGSGVYGPNEMPNMKYILDRVLATKTWKFDRGADYDATAADGSGAFVFDAVRAMHDVDARFGHYMRTPGYPQYIPEKSSLDSVCFKNDDGTTQEGAIVVTSAGVQWMAKDRAPRIPYPELNSWMYSQLG